MLKNPNLAKSIADVSWSQFFARLQAKAEEAGRQVVKVSPAYTSQTCSGCSHRQPMPLSVRVYECPKSGLVIHRDHNGSLNILAEAFQAVGRHSRVIPEAPACSPVFYPHVTNGGEKQDERPQAAFACESQPFQMVRQKGGTIMGACQIATQACDFRPRSVPTVMLAGDRPPR